MNYVIDGQPVHDINFFTKEGVIFGATWRLSKPYGEELPQWRLDEIHPTVDLKRKLKVDFNYEGMFYTKSAARKYSWDKRNLDLYIPFIEVDWDITEKILDMGARADQKYKVYTHRKTGIVMEKHLETIPKPENIKFLDALKEIADLADYEDGAIANREKIIQIMTKLVVGDDAKALAQLRVHLNPYSDNYRLLENPDFTAGEAREPLDRLLKILEVF